jgi:tungstate transport system substrate-binding protein
VVGKMRKRCIKDTRTFYRRSLMAAIALNLVLVATPVYAQDKSIIVASTTSTQDSGLFEYLLRIFKQKTGITVKVWALGTGQALDTARRGDADVVFVHSESAEEKFIAEGEGVKRFPVMYNDFVLIGPKDDPAGIKGMNDAAKAFQVIKQKQACFVSRGDHSGTHIAELNLWRDANTDIEKDRGPWYKSIGQGMGPALNFANASNCYVFSDRGTWIHFKNKGDLQILVEGDKRMFNQYGVILVNTAKHPNVKKELGQEFIDWLISPDGQKTIADYKIDGQQLFYPDANEPNRLIIWLTYQWGGFTGGFPGWADLTALGVLLVALTSGLAAPKRRQDQHQIAFRERPYLV